MLGTEGASNGRASGWADGAGVVSGVKRARRSGDASQIIRRHFVTFARPSRRSAADFVGDRVGDEIRADQVELAEANLGGGGGLAGGKRRDVVSPVGGGGEAEEADDG